MVSRRRTTELRRRKVRTPQENTPTGRSGAAVQHCQQRIVSQKANRLFLGKGERVGQEPTACRVIDTARQTPCGARQKKGPLRQVPKRPPQGINRTLIGSAGSFQTRSMADEAISENAPQNPAYILAEEHKAPHAKAVEAAGCNPALTRCESGGVLLF